MKHAKIVSVWAAGMVLLLAAWASMSAPQAAPKHQPAGDENWVTYKNPRFGFSLYYPSALFKPQPPAENGDGQVFEKEDGSAKIVIYGANNDENYSLKEYRGIILSEFGGYDKMDYSPTGKTWFVLSGYREDKIYYQKVMFSCGNKVINALSITFPTAEKQFYEPLIETMEDKFQTGRGTDTPANC